MKKTKIEVSIVLEEVGTGRYILKSNDGTIKSLVLTEEDLHGLHLILKKKYETQK